MVIQRSDLEKILEILAKKVKPKDLKWLEEKNPLSYANCRVWLEKKELARDMDNSEEIRLCIQYFLDAITREIGDKQSSDIPKAYMPKLGKIFGIDVPKKFIKKKIVAEILEKI